MVNGQKPASELMPHSDEARSILQARAKLLAKQENDKVQNNGSAFIRFKFSDDEDYGIPYQFVQEVLPNTDLAIPPFKPDFVAGVLNWRGSLITIVDLIRFFYPESVTYQQNSHQFIIVIEAAQITLGILVPQIEGTSVYQPNHLAMPLALTKAVKTKYILGLHQAMTALIQVETLVSDLSLEIKKSLYRVGDVHGSH